MGLQKKSSNFDLLTQAKIDCGWTEEQWATLLDAVHSRSKSKSTRRRTVYPLDDSKESFSVNSNLISNDIPPTLSEIGSPRHDTEIGSTLIQATPRMAQTARNNTRPNRQKRLTSEPNSDKGLNS